MSKVLPAGTVAPGFTLRATPDRNLSLSNLAGRPVVLALYPADWSPVCGDQIEDLVAAIEQHLHAKASL
jgi:peroxiredoxin